MCLVSCVRNATYEYKNILHTGRKECLSFRYQMTNVYLKVEIK
jgi:hypothetical protein